MRLRVASAFVAVVIYPPMALLLLDKGGVVDVGSDVSTAWVWVLAGFFTWGAFANLASRSKPERIWAPVSAVIAACCTVIAVGV